MKTNKKGISLIVLVVTIIVLAILAVTVIVSITNSGIINRATDTVKNYDLSEVRSLANLAWSEALINPNVTTTNEYLNYIINCLKGDGYTDTELSKYTIVADVNGVTVNLKGNGEDTPEVPDIPEYVGLTITKDTPNVTFTKADGVTPGNPDNLETGDIVIYGDYEYSYKSEWDCECWNESDINGWGVRLKDDCFEKTTTGELCGNIYGEPLVSMQYTYVTYVWVENNGDPLFGEGDYVMSGASIITAPAIPSSVTTMSSTFHGCSGLTTAPEIPSGVTTMSSTFHGCSGLTTAPVIPSGVTNMWNAFAGCSGLTTAPAIPSSVTEMHGTFSGCSGLTTAPDMSRATSVTSMAYTFEGCSSLTTAPEIPSGVTNMYKTFEGCTSLTTAPAIPSSITDMSGTFSGCSSLTTAPVIPSSVTGMSSTFMNCTSLTTAPEIPSSVTNMSSTFEGCSSLTTVPEIPSGVTNMRSTFRGCTSLTTAPAIPSSVTEMWGTFLECSGLTTAPVIPSSVTVMINTFRECTSLTGVVQINSSIVSDISFCFDEVSNSLTVKVPVSSTTYTTIRNEYGSSSTITIETFEP